MDLSIFQRDISEISASLSEGLERLQYGSYSERNPGMGKMRTCPFCRKRRFEFSNERCCNASHATSKRAYDPEHDVRGKRLSDRTERGFGPATRHEKGFYQEPCEPRVSEFSIKKFVKKLNHSQPAPTNMGRHNRLLTYNLLKDMKSDEFRNTMQLLLEGLPGFHEPTKPVDIASAPSFAEKVIVAGRKAKSRRRRKAQQLARRINFGLVAGKDGARRKQ